MKQHIVTIKGEEIPFRLTGEDAMAIEKKYDKTIFDVFGSLSVTRIIDLLKYMRKGVVMTQNMATALYDDMVEDGYTLERIYKEVIVPTAKISGFISDEQEKKLVTETA